MGIVKGIVLLLGLADALLKRAERKDLIEAGAAMAVRKGLEKGREEMQKVLGARRAVGSNAEYRRGVRERAARGTGDGQAG